MIVDSQGAPTVGSAVSDRHLESCAINILETRSREQTTIKTHGDRVGSAHVPVCAACLTMSCLLAVALVPLYALRFGSIA